ncbi:MAG: phosphohydrolase [Lachnospiraceae bacterium]|nr:phosphohydrolase [Lachnospiraceae bacterium]MEE0919631.1 phosphohydrolase [Lachnospiraceae bacterium]
MYEEEIEKYASDIIESENFKSTKNHFQHGNMTVYEHCMCVTKASLAIRDRLKIKCNDRDLVRGALLHDYFLYDWHLQDEKNAHKRAHGFCHPAIALKNARKEYNINIRQADIIIKHMWPLTIIPPLCREGWIVTMADKYCSTLETLSIRRGEIHERQMRRQKLLNMFRLGRV